MPKSVNLKQLMKYDDPREVPVYSIPEAARYLQIPAATLRSWVCGRNYPVEGGTKRFQPVIALPNKKESVLSFFNLVEAHVLSALRRHHGIDLRVIRRALRFVTKEFGWKRPLIEQSFQTDGVAIFVEHLGNMVDVSSSGQSVMREVFEAYLQRLEWESDTVTRLYPFTRSHTTTGPKSVLIDPRYSFGRPVLVESYVAVSVIAERYKAGDSIDALAKDYGCKRKEIEEEIRCELSLRSAA